MKRIILTVLTCLLCSPVFADITGLPFDDAQYSHILGGAYIGKVMKSQGFGPIETFGAVFVASFLKECYDESHGFKFDNQDIIISLSGVCLMYSVDFVIE